MSFYSERIVKNPKKKYRCDVCQKPITGQHVYIAGKNCDNDFCTSRMHEDCKKEQYAACKECTEGDCCTGSYWDCWKERLKESAYDYWDFMQRYIIISENGIRGCRAAMTYYGLDNKRTEFHDRLCAVMKIAKEKTKEITDNVDRFDCFDGFYKAIVELVDKEQYK